MTFWSYTYGNSGTTISSVIPYFTRLLSPECCVIGCSHIPCKCWAFQMHDSQYISVTMDIIKSIFRCLNYCRSFHALHVRHLQSNSILKWSKRLLNQRILSNLFRIWANSNNTYGRPLSRLLWTKVVCRVRSSGLTQQDLIAPVLFSAFTVVLITEPELNKDCCTGISLVHSLGF